MQSARYKAEFLFVHKAARQQEKENKNTFYYNIQEKLLLFDMGFAAVAVYLPLVLSFFTQKVFLGRRTTCHTQLFYRPDMAAPAAESPVAVFSCDEPATAPLAGIRGGWTRPRDVYGIIAFQGTGLRECMGKAVRFSAQFHQGASNRIWRNSQTL